MSLHLQPQLCLVIHILIGLLNRKMRCLVYSAVQCSAVQCSAVQYSAVQCSVLQYGAMKLRTMQCHVLPHKAGVVLAREV